MPSVAVAYSLNSKSLAESYITVTIQSGQTTNDSSC